MPFVAKIHRTWQDHFFESVLIGDGCWGWTAGHNPDGYAMWQPSGDIADQFGSKMRQMAYRVMWELLRGPIPEGLEIDHMCRMKGCINPDHCDPVTHKVNLRRIGEQLRPRIYCKAGHRLAETRRQYGCGRSFCGACYDARLAHEREVRLARGHKKKGRPRKVV